VKATSGFSHCIRRRERAVESVVETAGGLSEEVSAAVAVIGAGRTKIAGPTAELALNGAISARCVGAVAGGDEMYGEGKVWRGISQGDVRGPGGELAEKG